MNTPQLGDIRYKLDHDNRILYAERRDGLSKEKIYAEWHAIQQLEGFDPTYDTLVDYSQVTSVDIDYDDLKELNQAMPEHDPRTGNIAIVSGLKQGRYLLAKFFCLMTNISAGRKHQVFNSKAEAELWLLGQREH